MYSGLTRTKICSTCKEEKEVTQFSPRKERKSGFESRCKACNSKRALRYHEKNRDDVLPKMRTRATDRYKADPSEAKFWGRTNKEHIKRATPLWAEKQAIKAFYKACPPGMEVDHIIPLRGRNVSGLHVLSNLQYLTPSENSRKGNRLPDEVLEASDKEPKR